MGAMKLLATLRTISGKVRKTYNRALPEPEETATARCLSCDWGRDYCPLSCVPRDCPRCGSRIIQSCPSVEAKP